MACSPPFELTIRALGPDQTIIVGTVGPRVEGGRAFDVQRWFNGADPKTPIVPTPLPAPDSSGLFALAGGAVAVGLATVLVLRSHGSRPRA